MDRHREQDLLTTTILYQLKGIRGRVNIDYVRLMKHFDKDSDTIVHNLYNYIKEFPLSKNDTLTDLYRRERIHRQEEFWERKKDYHINCEVPYSIDALFNLS